VVPIKIPVHLRYSGKAFYWPVPLGTVGKVYSHTDAYSFHNKVM